MGSTFGKTDELNRPALGNYRLALPFALFLKRSPMAPGTSPNQYLNDTVILDRIESYSVDEPVAVSIRPTLDGGKYITNRGMVKKTIQVSGSTGYMPNGVNQTFTPTTALFPAPGEGTILQPDSPGLLEGNIASFTSQALVGINQANPVAETNRENNSGFIRFVKLRNLCREYARIKKIETPEIANSTYMYFYDRKLDEWWVVEIIDFKLFRSSKKPFMFDYSLVLETICPGSDTGSDPFNVDLPTDKEMTRTPGVLIGLSGDQQEALRVVSRLSSISTSITIFAGKFVGAVRDAFNNMLLPLNQTINIFNSVADITQTLASLPTGLVLQMNGALDNMLSTVARFTSDAKLLSAVNDVYIETRQLTDSLFARAARLFSGQQSTESPVAVLQKESDKYVQQRLKNGTGGVNVNDPNGSTTLPTTPFVNGAGFNLITQIDFSKFDSVAQKTVFRDENIFALAARTTGSIFTVPFIISLNRLQFPYIVAPDSPFMSGTLKPGDPVLVPAISKNTQQPQTQSPLLPASPADFLGQVTAVSGVFVQDSMASGWRDHQWTGFTFTVIQGTGAGEQAVILDNNGQVLTLANVLTLDTTSVYTITLIQQQKIQPLTPLEIRYGVDALVVFRGGQGSPYSIADATLGPTGDLVTVAGLANYVQALTILSYTEQGRNLANPFYGMIVPIGEKNNVDRAVAFSFSVRAAILADPRTDSIKNIIFSINRDISAVNVTVVPIGGVDQVLSLPSLL